MNRKRKTTKTLAILAMMVVLLLPMRSAAQYRENRYGLQPWFGQKSLMNREGSGGNSYGINSQEFGSTPTGGIGVEEFGSPLGSGVLFLLAAGAGYATLKRRKNESTTGNE